MQQGSTDWLLFIKSGFLIRHPFPANYSVLISAKLFVFPNGRKELIAQYSRLTEEAARRERRAMWRVQRLRLGEARAQFFQRDGLQIQVCNKRETENESE